MRFIPSSKRLHCAVKSALTCLLGGTLASGALAQESPVLEEVTVYGSRIANTLEDNLSSIGIVTRQDIEDMDLRSFREAFRTLGNVMDSDWVDGGFIIRGVNSEGLTPGGSPLAALYVDGAQQTVNGARRGARGVWDVEQVEVYRGPQSTLSGRAALAGAIYIKTQDPTFEWDARVRGIYGSDELKNGAIAFGGPLIEDQLAFRISGEYQISEEDDIDNSVYEAFDRYDEYVEDEYHQVRAKLLYTPEGMPDTRALLTYSTTEDSPTVRDIAGPVLGYDYDERNGNINPPVWTESRTAETDNLIMEINHALNERWQFTSLTSWSESDTARPSINEGTPGETEITEGYQLQQLFTQEFRFNYSADSFDAVAGLYYASDEIDNAYTRNAFGRLDVGENTRDTTNYALFGELTWHLTGQWRLIAGGRTDYTDQEDYAFFSRNGVTNTDQKTEFDESVFLPKIGTAYDIDDNQTVGFVVQQGFRNGGAGVQTSTGDDFQYDPEYTWNYELSYKGSFAGGRLSVSSNIFYTDWEDQQVEFREDPLDFTSTLITNAARSEAYGFELDTRYQLTSSISAFTSIGYTKTEFTEFVDASLGDLSGFPFPEAPEWNIALGARYESAAGFYLGMDAKWLDEYLARFGQPPQEYLDGYWVANAQAGWKSGHWNVSVFAENLFDEEYFVYNDANAAGDIAATLGYPQRVGLSLSYQL